MAEDAGPPTLLAIIAGHGDLPKQIAERRATAKLPYLLVVFQDCWEDWMGTHPHQRHEFEKIGAVFRSLREASATHVVFAGAMNRPKLKLWRADLKAVGVAAKAIRLLGQGDDKMLRGFAGIIESEGLTMIGPGEILGDEMMVRPGPLGTQSPSARDRADAAIAAGIVAAVGALDVGQGAVVADGVCLAVEAIEGTDMMLARVAGLPAEKRASAPPPSGVLFKGPKPEQDQRLDQPTIGLRTIEAVVSAGLNGVVVAAGETVLLDGSSVRSSANAAGIFVYGATPEELRSWSS